VPGARRDLASTLACVAQLPGVAVYRTAFALRGSMDHGVSTSTPVPVTRALTAGSAPSCTAADAVTDATVEEFDVGNENEREEEDDEEEREKEEKES